MEVLVSLFLPEFLSHIPGSAVYFVPVCQPLCAHWPDNSNGASSQLSRKSRQLRRLSMKKIWMWYLIGLLSLGSAARLQAQMTGGTEKAVAALEEQWMQSQKTNNPDLVAPLLADKFVNTTMDGKVIGRAETLANAKATKYDSIEYEDVKVTVFGDTAIATGVSKAKGTDESGKPLDEHVRWTDTWVKMPNGKWQCVASHGSPVKV
jgi:uncharacterized protein (TIGR02246 family)